MTDLDTYLGRLRELEEAASPGPWQMYYTFGCKDLPSEIRHGDGTRTHLEWNSHSDSSCADVELIPVLRNALPVLIAIAEAQSRALEEIKSFWLNTQTPKPYFIGDTCDDALAEVRRLIEEEGR